MIIPSPAKQSSLAKLNINRLDYYFNPCKSTCTCRRWINYCFVHSVIHLKGNSKNSLFSKIFSLVHYFAPEYSTNLITFTQLPQTALLSRSSPHISLYFKMPTELDHFDSITPLSSMPFKIMAGRWTCAHHMRGLHPFHEHFDPKIIEALLI